jgi:predicted chitinase
VAAALAVAAAGTVAVSGMPGVVAAGLAGAAKKIGEQSDEGKNEKEVNKYVTAAQLKDFGWIKTSDQEVIALNATLGKYGITSQESIALFLATCGHESGKGSNSLEKLNKDGTTVGEYKKNERGAGYIQITWKDTHKKFLKTVNDSFDGEDTATYISDNYPWEAAGWFWSSKEAKSTAAGSLNDYTGKYGSSKGVFLVTQYLVNGWADGLTTEIATSIRDGKVPWKVKNNKLYVNDKIICDAPIGWEDREKNYDDAINHFK